jgi:hypothetical protein
MTPNNHLTVEQPFTGARVEQTFIGARFTNASKALTLADDHQRDEGDNEPLLNRSRRTVVNNPTQQTGRPLTGPTKRDG